MTTAEAISKPEAQKRAPMRQRILDSATTLFCKKGYVATSLREILGECGVSAPAMYNHFKSKEALLYVIYREAHDEVQRQFDAALDGVEDAPEPRLRALIKAYVTYQATHHETAHVIDANYVHLPEKWKVEAMAQRRSFRRDFQQAIEAGAEAGVFSLPESSGKSPALMATIIIGDYCMRVATWYRGEGEMAAEDVANIYAEYAIRMLKPHTP